MVVVLFLLLGVVVVEGVRLHAEGRWLYDENGNQVHLACVNWYGGAEKDFVVGGLAYQSMQYIANLTVQYGFNCVRIPW